MLVDYDYQNKIWAGACGLKIGWFSYSCFFSGCLILDLSSLWLPLLSLLCDTEKIKQEQVMELNLSCCPLVRKRCDVSLLKFDRICLSCIHFFTLNQTNQWSFCTAKHQALSLYHACRSVKTHCVRICDGKGWPQPAWPPISISLSSLQVNVIYVFCWPVLAVAEDGGCLPKP